MRPLLTWLLACVCADNTFYLSHVFGDGMVLQARIPAVLWGFAKQGAVVTTYFNQQTFSTTAGVNFIWRQTLPAMNASSLPYNLSFSSSSGGSTVSLSDVVFGEVFICGGQSNMQMSLSAVLNASDEIANAQYPNIRIFTVGQDTASTTPLSDLKTFSQPWMAVTPSTITDNQDFGLFSAICYFFARDLQAVLGKDTPIGAISDNWSGTCLEEWTLPEINQECGLPWNPTLYNAMFRPYTVGPMSIAGFIWSQGECNADHMSVPYYNCAFPLFIRSLRDQFNNPNMFFGFELLPAYIRDSTFDPASLPYEREAQLNGLTAGGSVAVCNAMDLGDPSAPHGSVHPRNKQDVGQRLANAAVALLYGQKVPYLNPTYASGKVRYDGLTITATISFKPETLGGGKLVLKSGVCPDPVPPEECAWDQIQTDDGVWHNATSSLSADGTKLILNITTSQPMRANATRGTFSPWPVVHLYSAAGLPALPWSEPLIDDEDCKVRVGGKIYDFTMLEKQTQDMPLVWIDARSPPEFEYDFTFCSARTKFCKDESNLCQKQLVGPSEISLGVWNSTWTAVSGGIQSTFIGESCQTSVWQTQVVFSCSHATNTTFIVNVNNTSPCHYAILIQLQQDVCTSLAPTPPTSSAPTRLPTTLAPSSATPTPAPSVPTPAPTYATPCIVTVAGNEYDFTSLEARTAVLPLAWIDNSTPPVYEYDLTFCRTRMDHCNASNVCQIALESSAAYNDGVWSQTEWTAIAGGGLQAIFNGSSCEGKGVRQTTLTLSCRDVYEETTIVSVTETSTCQYAMLVQLEAAVCNQSSTPSPTAEPTPLPTPEPSPVHVPCAFNVSGWVYNFSTLEAISAQQPFSFSDNLFNYSLAFCSSHAHPCGGKSNLCEASRSTPSYYSMGMWSTNWTRADGGITAVFTGGSPCKGGQFRQTRVLLSCKDSVERTTILSVSDLGSCAYSMVVDIPRSLCPPSPAPPTSAPTFATPCVVTVGNTNYDFSALEAQSSRFPFGYTDKNYEYDFAICRSRDQRCAGNSSICQVSRQTGAETNLGVWNSQWTTIDGGIQSILIGEACDAGKKFFQTTLQFLCKGAYNRTSIVAVASTAPCQYTMSVQLQASVCFPVNPPTPGPTSKNWASIGIIIGGAVLIAGAVAYLACRRKGLASEGYRPI